jgi:hypothetical protein
VIPVGVEPGISRIQVGKFTAPANSLGDQRFIPTSPQQICFLLAPARRGTTPLHIAVSKILKCYGLSPTDWHSWPSVPVYKSPDLTICHSCLLRYDSQEAIRAVRFNSTTRVAAAERLHHSQDTAVNRVDLVRLV